MGAARGCFQRMLPRQVVFRKLDKLDGLFMAHRRKALQEILKLRHAFCDVGPMSTQNLESEIPSHRPAPRLSS